MMKPCVMTSHLHHSERGSVISDCLLMPLLTSLSAHLLECLSGNVPVNLSGTLITFLSMLHDYVFVTVELIEDISAANMKHLSRAIRKTTSHEYQIEGSCMCHPKAVNLLPMRSLDELTSDWTVVTVIWFCSQSTKKLFIVWFTNWLAGCDLQIFINNIFASTSIHQVNVINNTIISMQPCLEGICRGLHFLAVAMVSKMSSVR